MKLFNFKTAFLLDGFMIDVDKCCMTLFPAGVLAEKAEAIDEITDEIARLADVPSMIRNRLHVRSSPGHHPAPDDHPIDTAFVFESARNSCLHPRR